jgi:peptidoglycan/xylan/chitin deacetylase (PgdA/CDA1 family)
MTETRPDPSLIDPVEYQRERYLQSDARHPLLWAYYAVRPMLPRSVQIALRRRYSVHQQRRTFPAWPIEPLLVDRRYAQLRRELAASPDGRVPVVNIWPEGRRFAAVMTHDVESPAGIERIPAVLEVERRHGIVSSWNFCGEWYPIPAGTFELIRAAGGEIGLHGVKHDGRLFRDRATFEGELPKIHRYLRDWGAVGFRSPATHRNAAWMPELGCLYDSSFPDTDPFEPQPGGCCSPYPFLIDDLVELPITLVQDHTLWEILRDPSINCWREKTEWLIAHQGLVNLIVHPDYVRSERRLALYDEFLEYLRSRLDQERGWHALPREVATWWRAREGVQVQRGEVEAGLVGDQSWPDEVAPPSIAWVSERDGRLIIDA